MVERYGQRSAFTFCVKIADQLPSMTLNSNAKTATPQDTGTGFQGALSASVTAEVASTDVNRQNNLKPTQNAKPQTAELKKKAAASDSTHSDIAAPSNTTSKPLPQDATNQLDVALSVNGGASSQVSDDLQVGSEENQSGASTTPRTPVTSPRFVTTNDRPSEVKVDNAAISVSPIDLTGAPAAQESTAGSPGSHPAFNIMKTPASNSTATTELIATPSAETLKTADPSTPFPSVNPTDPATLAAQQAAVTVAQSVATTVSLPNLTSASEFEASPLKSANLNSVEGALKESAAHPNFPAKTKPALVPSEVRGRVADEKEVDTQEPNVSSASASVVKIPEAPGTLNHPITNSGGAVDAAILQVVPQSTSYDGSNHLLQTTQSVSASTDSPIQTTASPVTSDTQAMQGVTSAQLTQSMRSSEMKLGMQSAEFGNISISTSLNHQAISAQISIDHAELGRALAVHLPAIEEKLGSAYGVQAKVELRESNNPSSFNESGYSNSGQQSREQRQSERAGIVATQGALFEQSANRTSLTPNSRTANAARLDIRI